MASEDNGPSSGVSSWAMYLERWLDLVKDVRYLEGSSLPMSHLAVEYFRISSSLSCKSCEYLSWACRSCVCVVAVLTLL